MQNAIGGKPALRFEKAKSWLAVQLPDDPGKAFVGSVAVFAVFTGATPKGDSRILSAVTDKGADYIRGTGFKVTDDGPPPADLKHGVLLKPQGFRVVGTSPIFCNNSGLAAIYLVESNYA